MTKSSKSTTLAVTAALALNAAIAAPMTQDQAQGMFERYIEVQAQSNALNAERQTLTISLKAAIAGGAVVSTSTKVPEIRQNYTTVYSVDTFEAAFGGDVTASVLTINKAAVRALIAENKISAEALAEIAVKIPGTPALYLVRPGADEISTMTAETMTVEAPVVISQDEAQVMFERYVEVQTQSNALNAERRTLVSGIKAAIAEGLNVETAEVKPEIRENYTLSYPVAAFSEAFGDEITTQVLMIDRAAVAQLIADKEITAEAVEAVGVKIASAPALHLVNVKPATA